MINIGPKIFHNFVILLTSALSLDDIIDLYSKFWQFQFRLYVLNHLLIQNPLPLVWKILSCSFKILNNYDVITISFMLKWEYFLYWKQFFSNFWSTDTLNTVDLSFYSFLRDLHTDNTLVANNYTASIKSDWMGLNNVKWCVFLETDEILLMSAKKTIT